MIAQTGKPAIALSEVEIDSLVDSVCEAREEALQGREHYVCRRDDSWERLKQAVAVVFVPYFGALCRDTLVGQVAYLAALIAQDHPFEDGNKRTAALVPPVMLAYYGEGMTFDAPDEEFYQVIVALASHRMDDRAFGQWIEAHVVGA